MTAGCRTGTGSFDRVVCGVYNSDAGVTAARVEAIVTARAWHARSSQE
jgi:hypothetical protein